MTIHILILGGGAAGILTALKLSAIKSKYGLEVTLVDPKTYFEYTPGIVAVLGTPLDKLEKKYQEITQDYQELLGSWGVNFIQDEVEEVQQSEVILKSQKRLTYTYLIVATGSSYPSPFKPTSTETTYAERLKALKEDRASLESASRVLCVGLGPVGIEMAGELIGTKDLSVIHGSDEVLPGIGGGRLGEKVLSVLKQNDVNLILGEKAEEKSPESFSTVRTFVTDKTRQSVEVEKVYISTGLTPNTKCLEKNFSSFLNKGFVRVNEYFQIPDHSQIFCIGDIIDIGEQKLYFTAHMQAMHLFKNITNLLASQAKGQEPELMPYLGVRLAMVLSIGPSRGIAFIDPVLNVVGFGRGSYIAGAMKWCIERITMHPSTKILVNEVLYFIQKHRSPALKPKDD
ncbi:hypothetical protein K7432_003652 [Basidiobolus ranarum]|uniref:FAD/NAD(P)-binding domain-containing protein n=1 Tax=Basidiobolus ranarum TaxID=34480 RepID=A0ABR2WZP1_9FUNG